MNFNKKQVFKNKNFKLNCFFGKIMAKVSIKYTERELNQN